MEEQKYEIEDLQMDVEHKNMLKNLIIDKEKEADSYVVQGLNILNGINTAHFEELRSLGLLSNQVFIVFEAVSILLHDSNLEIVLGNPEFLHILKSFDIQRVN